MTDSEKKYDGGIMDGLKNTTLLYSIRKVIEEVRVDNYDYEKYLKSKQISDEELICQKSERFGYEPLISIITHIDSVNSTFLSEMIESILSQTYSNFELCIADNSNGEEAGNVISRYINADSRIRYVRSISSNGPGGNLSEAFDMSSGEFIMYVNANDELSPNALFEFVKVINKKARVDIIYCDEDSIANTKKKYDHPVFKPNFNYDLLRTNNYIGNSMLVRRRLVKKTGGFNDRFSSAYMYDFVLRCTEGTELINHISMMLYHSRKSDTTYDREEMIEALSEHFARTGIIADVIEMDSKGYFRINYHMETTPHITVVINDVATDKELKKSIDSVRARTIYSEYDIIVKKNGCKLRREQIEGEYVIAINSDMMVTTNNFIEKMLSRISQGDVRVVSTKIIDQHKKILHAGIKYSNKTMKYLFLGMPSWQYGYCLRSVLQQNVDAFPVAGIILKKEDYLDINYNELKDNIDVKLCEELRHKKQIFSYEPSVIFQKR